MSKTDNNTPSKSYHPVGVAQRGDRWIAYITYKGKFYNLGRYGSPEEALAIRKEAESISRSDFLAWYSKFSALLKERAAVRRKNKLPVRGKPNVGVSKSGNRWAAYITHAGKSYNLGRYDSPEDARAARKEAEETPLADFLEWYAEFKARPKKCKRVLHRNHPISISVSLEELEMINNKATELALSRTELIIRAVETYIPGDNNIATPISERSRKAHTPVNFCTDL